MNHLELLKKYMRIVICARGYAYTDILDADMADVAITEDELAELKRIEMEVDND